MVLVTHKKSLFRMLFLFLHILFNLLACYQGESWAEFDELCDHWKVYVVILTHNQNFTICYC